MDPLRTTLSAGAVARAIRTFAPGRQWGGNVLTIEVLIAYFTTAARESALRLELLDHNRVDDNYRHLDGDGAPTHERTGPWLDQRSAEQRIGFLRHGFPVLKRPPTPYLRYECIWGCAPNVRAGERVFILDAIDWPCSELGVDLNHLAIRR